MTTAQLSLAWMLSKRDDIVPIPGTKQLKYFLMKKLKSVEINVNPEEVVKIESAISVEDVQGACYTEVGLVGIEEY